MTDNILIQLAQTIQDGVGTQSGVLQCKQCLHVEHSEEEFARHLRTHLSGHRTRQFRKPEKNTKEKSNSSDTNIMTNMPFLKFDSLTSSQFEISQPNTVTNLMHTNLQNREICEKLVNPSIVMPSKHNEVIENTQLNFAEVLNPVEISNCFSNNIIMTLNQNESLAIANRNENISQVSTNVASDLDSLIKESITSVETNEIQMEIGREDCATITPLNLYYIGDNLTSSTVESLGISQINSTSGLDNAVCNLDSTGQSNIVLVDNSKTVGLIDFNGQIITGNHIEIVPVQNEDAKSSNNGLFSCEICHKQFTKSTYLYRHLRKHIGDFTCKYCDKTFARKETWLAHCCKEKLKAQQNSLHKPPSDKTTSTEVKIDNFNKVEHKKNETTSKETLNKDNSLQATEGKQRKVKCEVCGLMVSDKSCLKRHMQTHERLFCYTCVYCGEIVKHRHSIRRHLKIYHPDYEHEWNNTVFITSMQTDIKNQPDKGKSSAGRAGNMKKKKLHHKRKGKDSANLKIPTHCPKKDSLLGTTILEDLKIDFGMLKKSIQNGVYSNDKSNNCVREDSLDLSSFTAHFDEEIGHVSFQALALPDVLCKGITGELVKIDSKENSPIKNFNIGSLLLFNTNGSKKTNEALPEILFGETSNTSPTKIDVKLCSKSKVDANLFAGSMEGRFPLMPSMPVLFCEEEQNHVAEKPNEFKAGVEILVCQPVEETVTPQKTQSDIRSSVFFQEETIPSCSAGYVLEENASMQLVDTSSDLTFFVLR